MSMAVVTREYTEGDRVLVEYESGTVADKATGRIVSSKPVFTSDNARAMVALRTQKAAAAARRAMIEATNASGMPGAGGLPVSVKSSIEAFAVGVGVLWEQGVMNPDARLDHRTKALHEIGLITEMIAPKQTAAESVSPAQAAQIGATAAVLALALAELNRRNNG